MTAVQTLVANKQLFEVNLCCELTYPEHEMGQERYELGLCDYNLVFLTDLDESASPIDLLKDLNSRFPEEMDKFFLEVVEEHADAFCDYSVEYRSPRKEGCFFPDDDELLVMDDECPFSED